MPCIVPSHQAPVLALKRWRPAWFSGLGLCLGSAAPDLEFILRVDNDWIVSHTFAAQVYFTVPLALVLHALLLSLVLPYWLPRCPSGPPLHLDQLLALRPARRPRDWARVAVSAYLGGLTHVLIDGVTHGNHSGWAVPYLPWLRTPVIPGLPLHDLLQVVLSVLFAVMALRTWDDMARSGTLWRSCDPRPRAVSPLPPAEGRKAHVVLVALALAGAAFGAFLRRGSGPAVVLEVALFGALAFAFWGLFGLPAAARLWPRARTTLPPRPLLQGEG